MSNTTETTGTIDRTPASYQRPDAFALITLSDTDGQPIDESYRLLEADASVLDADFLLFVSRYAANLGHMSLGTLAYLADAEGIEVMGDYLLVRAQDPKAVVWPGASYDFANLIAVMARDESYRMHAVSEDEASAPVRPAIPMAKEALYRAGEPQPEYGWLPLVFCRERDGFGKTVRDDSLEHGFGDLASRLEAMLNEALGEAGIEATVITAESKEDALSKLRLLRASEGEPEA